MYEIVGCTVQNRTDPDVLLSIGASREDKSCSLVLDDSSLVTDMQLIILSFKKIDIK